MGIHGPVLWCKEHIKAILIVFIITLIVGIIVTSIPAIKDSPAGKPLMALSWTPFSISTIMVVLGIGGQMFV